MRSGHPTVLFGPELVVFASPGDVGCAHVAAAWLSKLADPHKVRAVVGASRMPVRIPPHIKLALHECAAESDDVDTRLLSADLLAAADMVITLGGSFDRRTLVTRTPIYREHWLVEPDLAATDGPGRARSMRDLIRSRVAMLVFTAGWERLDISREEARVTRVPFRQGKTSARA